MFGVWILVGIGLFQGEEVADRYCSKAGEGPWVFEVDCSGGLGKGLER